MVRIIGSISNNIANRRRQNDGGWEEAAVRETTAGGCGVVTKSSDDGEAPPRAVRLQQCQCGLDVIQDAVVAVRWVKQTKFCSHTSREMTRDRARLWWVTHACS